LRISKVCQIIVLFVVLLSALIAIHKPTAETTLTTAKLSVQPQSIVDVSLHPDSTFKINCSVFNVVDLFTWQIKLLFDPLILNCTGAYYPSDHVFAGKTMVPVAPIIDNDVGYVLYGCSLMGAQPGFEGNGTLCQIEFKVKSIGESELNYSRPYAEDTYLLDSDLNVIPAEVENGYFNNSPAPPLEYTLTITSTVGGTTDPKHGSYKYPNGTEVSVTATPNTSYAFDHWELDGTNQTINPIIVVMNRNHTLKAVFCATAPPPATILSVDPKEIIDPTLLPSSTFNVNVTINRVENLHMCYLNLSYDTGVLSWMRMEVFKVQNVTPIANAILNDDGGYVWLNLTYLTSVTVHTPTALFTVKFHVDALGASVLSLHDTGLFDEEGNPIPHDTIDGYFATLIRDVAIVNVVPSSDWAYRGWKLNITVTAKNIGDVNETFNVKAFYDDNLIGTATVENLPPETEVNVSLIWDTSGIPEGNYTLKALATEVPYEYNVTNNVLVDGRIWIMELIHDVAVTNVTFPYNWAYQGWNVNITVTAVNIGNYSETFNVSLYIDSNLTYTYNVVNIPSGEGRNFTYTLDTKNFKPCSNYTVTAEATLVPYEYNVTNNKYMRKLKIKLLGDLNDDGKVDMLDVAIAQEAFGAFPSDPRWNPAADVNLDYRVDLRDIAVIAHNFGKTC